MIRARRSAQQFRGSCMRTVLAAMLLWTVPALSDPAHPFKVESSDILTVLGGEDAVAWQFNGYFEALLARAIGAGVPKVRYLAWEGDTVYAQPRDLNFPSWPEQLRRIGATVVFFQFGQAESLDPTRSPSDFHRAYAEFLREIAGPGLRLVLVSPTPFEKPSGPLPDRTPNNVRLGEYVGVIRSLAGENGLLFIDLFSIRTNSTDRVAQTRDGLHLNAAGQSNAAVAMIGQLGMGTALRGVPSGLGAGDAMASPELEQLRRVVLVKNRLWFDYWRPQNWAFLNGDRMDQPSSHDHRNPKIRWFPTEMEQFLPLIVAEETRIRQIAASLASSTPAR
jgi:hypothetical protein